MTSRQKTFYGLISKTLHNLVYLFPNFQLVSYSFFNFYYPKNIFHIFKIWKRLLLLFPRKSLYIFSTIFFWWDFYFFFNKILLKVNLILVTKINLNLKWKQVLCFITLLLNIGNWVITTAWQFEPTTFCSCRPCLS